VRRSIGSLPLPEATTTVLSLTVSGQWPSSSLIRGSESGSSPTGRLFAHSRLVPALHLHFCIAPELHLHCSGVRLHGGARSVVREELISACSPFLGAQQADLCQPS